MGKKRVESRWHGSTVPGYFIYMARMAMQWLIVTVPSSENSIPFGQVM